MRQNFVRNVVLVVTAIIVSVWAITPPSEKLRLGKDLAGGVSLTYAVEIEAREDAQAVLSKTIEVLKERVNPAGTLDISMIAQGENRLEISMPLPTDRVRGLREAYEERLRDLSGLAIDAGELERSFRLDGAERAALVERLSRGDAARARLINDAAGAADAATSARRAVEEATRAGADQAVVDDLVAKAADAETAFEGSRRAALAVAVRPDEVRRALELPNLTKTVLDREKGEAIVIPSPRARAVERLRAAHPDAAGAIDAAVSAFGAYEAERRGFDDPQDLVRLLRGSGVLNFRIAVQPGELADEGRLREALRERGPRAARQSGTVWLPLEDIDAWYDSVQQLRAIRENAPAFFASMNYVVEERDGIYYMLLHDAPGKRLTSAEGRWAVAEAFGQPDQRGFPGIGFRMDAVGASLLSDLTGANVGRAMAVVLDDKVYTAPNLQGRISSSGQITGGSSGFTQQEINYITQTLNAGSLTAKLSPSPLQIDVTGPELGRDNLDRGLTAGGLSLLVTALFMATWYFTSGLIAVAGLACNALFLLGLMALGQAAFTMPGIAGVVLTFGMAVDANVLIYERVREELRAGQNVKAAIRTAFQRALPAIVDGNMTTFIVAMVLYWTGTTEIKGFAVTLGLGILTTLFSALLVSRILFTIGIERLRWRTLSQLPMAVPALGRILNPNVDWLRIRYAFYGLSLALVGLGVVMIIRQGSEMLDNEFRGGTAVTFNTRVAGEPTAPGEEPQRLRMTRAEVETTLREFIARQDNPALRPMLNADVIVLNPDRDQVTSDTFQIKTVVSDPDLVSGAVIGAFGDRLDVRPPLSLASSRTDPIVDASLGANIGRPEVRDDVRAFLGGAAVVVEGISPPQPLEDLTRRADQLRSQPDFADTLGRSHAVIVLEGTPEAVTSAAFVAVDANLSFFEDEARWRAEVAATEEALVRDALTKGSSLAGVQAFSPAIAQTFAAQAAVSVLLAIVGILIYVWVRFGSVRYSLGAIIADIHDAFIAIGLIAVVEVVYEQFPGVAAALGLAPFKVDLAMVAAILTVLGYSLNDSIVVMDRIRENRGKLAYASREVINLSLNQTFSRTLITGGTTLLSCLILYLIGGPSIRGFAFAIFVGVIVGTYSSIGIAAPFVWNRRPPPSRPTAGRDSGSAAALATT